MKRLDDVLASLPVETDDEPGSLRRDIADELMDHLACAMERELAGGKDDEAALKSVLRRFGNPQVVALKLWKIHMKGRIMRDRFLIASMSVLLVTQLFLVVFLVWMIVPRLETTEELRTSNKDILLALQDVQKALNSQAEGEVSSVTEQVPIEQVHALRTEDEVEFQGAYFRVIGISSNDPADENDDDVTVIARLGAESDEVTLEEFRLENVLGGKYTIVAEDIRPSVTPGEGRVKLRFILNTPNAVSSVQRTANELEREQPRDSLVVWKSVNEKMADHIIAEYGEMIQLTKVPNEDGTYAVKAVLNEDQTLDSLRKIALENGFLLQEIR